MNEPDLIRIYRYEITVPKSAVDINGHVNNVVYVQWMQDVAVLHSDTVGGTRAMHAVGGTWVVHSHKIEYLSPAFINVVISTFLFYMTNELGQTIVNCTTCHFCHFNLLGHY